MSGKHKILIARRLPPDVEERADRDYEVVLNESDAVLSPDELLAGSQGCDGLLVSASEKLPAAAIEKLPASVKIVATFSVGYEHIDIPAAKKRGLTVTNTPEVLSDCTADVTFLLILGAARRAYEAQSMLRRGEWYGWAPTQLMGTKVTGKRLGILGMGRIGQAVAARARGFGMQVHYHNRTRLPADLEMGATYHETPESLLRVSDFFSINCPATAENHHFLNSERIELLPERAIVVNSARGALVDDDALISALRSGRLAAAGLDVYEGEPRLNPGYLPLENAYLLPHIGSGSVETRNAMGFKCLDNLDAVLSGRPPLDPVT